MSKSLVAYFSASGVTAGVAEKLAAAADADLFAICPKEAYSKKDLNWRNPLSRSSVEMRKRDIRPELDDSVIDLSGYDRIFLGFPIWWYVAPTLINTFLEAHDFAGKTIVLFATSGGSGFGKTVDGLKPSVDASATMIEGRLFNGDFTPEDYRAFVQAYTE